MTRLHVLTDKVETRFGSLYTAVSHDDDGHIRDVKIFSPQKFGDTDMDIVIQSLAKSLQDSINSIPGRT